MSYKFRGVIILEGEDLGAKEVNEMPTMLDKSLMLFPIVVRSGGKTF